MLQITCSPPEVTPDLADDRYRWRDGRPMRRGPNGFLIGCAHCRKEFDSKGLRCCSPDCERAYCARKDDLAALAAIGIMPAAKRPCAQCGAPIPNWRDGRRVSGKTQFCSPKCRLRAFRNDLSLPRYPSDQTADLKRFSAREGL